jgi:hypothetical protein
MECYLCLKKFNHSYTCRRHLREVHQQSKKEIEDRLTDQVKTIFMKMLVELRITDTDNTLFENLRHLDEGGMRIALVNFKNLNQ